MPSVVSVYYVVDEKSLAKETSIIENRKFLMMLVSFAKKAVGSASNVKSYLASLIVLMLTMMTKYATDNVSSVA